MRQVGAESELIKTRPPPIHVHQLFFSNSTDVCKINHSNKHVYVVVNFLFQLIFIFPLFLDMVIYAKEFKTKENKN